MAEASEQADGEQRELLLDPFAFHVGVASRILGLGGDTPSQQPNYAFHTAYVEAAPGPAHFNIRFRGLTARRGTLQIRVNMLPMEEGAHARVANTDRIQLNRLVQSGGTASIRFEAFRGVTFALHGFIADDTDAAATGLEVALDRPADPTRDDNAHVEARSSAFGRDMVKPAIHMISMARASFATPVAQMCTRNQLGEPAFAEHVRALQAGNAPPLDQWCEAYIVQVLQRYGMIGDKAAGLGLCRPESGVPAVLAAHGIQVTVAEPSADVREGDVTPDREGNIHRFEPAALPGKLVNFDFLWSLGITDCIGTIGDALAFAERAMGCLRPGGLAIHLFPMDLARGKREEADLEQDRTLFRRGDMERLALILISRKFEVAQIKIDEHDVVVEDRADERRITRFGIIARRPPSAL